MSASAKVMSQCRRGTPSVPAPIMKSEMPAIPIANTYGCSCATFGNITCRRKISGTTRYVIAMKASVVPATTVAWKWPGT